MTHAWPAPGTEVAVKGGVHLAEALVASGVLAVVLASLPPLFAAAVEASVAAGDGTVATLLAAQRLEAMRAQAFADLPAAVGVELLDAAGRPVAGGTTPRFTRGTWVVPLPRFPARGVVVTVVVARYRSGDAHGFDGGRPGAVRVRAVRTRRAA